MIEIDGSHGEGGGQILRTAAALAVHLEEGIHVRNIRAGRPDPGLKNQHMTVLQALAEISGGSLTGATLGSREITFVPGSVRGGSYRFDIGTAGSIPLLFITLTLALSETREIIEVEAIGGTDARWAPPWDHFRNVFLPLARMAGADAEARLVRRGYFPAGGGRAILAIRPGKLRTMVLDREEEPHPKIEGIVNVARLDEAIAKRMRSSAVIPIMASGSHISVRIDRAEADSPGVGIVLWSEKGNSILGASALGEKGIPAEKLGTAAAVALLEELGSGATVDRYSADQIVPLLALAGEGSAFTVREITGHTSTGIALVRHMLDRNVEVEKDHGVYTIRV